MNDENMLDIQRCDDAVFESLLKLKRGDFLFYHSEYGDGSYEPVRFHSWEKQNGIVMVYVEDYSGVKRWGYAKQFTLIEQTKVNIKKLW